MTKLDQNTIEAAWRYLKKAKVFTIGELVSVLKCSIPNVRIKLKQWQTYTSYNCNGKFYAMPQVPKFNHHGLWHYENVAFSKHGNLKKTIVHLVTSAHAGLTGRQLGELLGLSPQSFMHHFRNCPGIYREKHNGVYVYFSENTLIYERQKQQRISLVCQPAVVTISNSEAVLILVAIIRHHGISSEDILALPEIKKSRMKLTDIKGFLEHHGLEKKILVSEH